MQSKLLTYLVAVLVIITLIVFVAGYPGDLRKEEVARRAQCKHNMVTIAEHIEAFRQKFKKWPATLKELDYSVPLCPSAMIGISVEQKTYIWNSNSMILTEDSYNHDVKRLKISECSNVTHSVIFSANGKWELNSEYR